MKEAVPFRSVLIFGGAGFVGSNWAHRLLTGTQASVHIFDNLSRPGVRHNLEWLKQAARGSNRLKVTLGDVRDAAAVRKAARSASEIYHFAAQVAVTTSLTDPRADFEVNAAGTLNILEAARAGGRRPFLLFTSTNKVYGHIVPACLSRDAALRHPCGERDCIPETQPLDFYSPYGCSKGAADQYVRDYARIFGLPTVVFRMSCIAGPRQFGNEDQGWVAHFLYSALQGREISIYGDGRQVRDVLAVQDLVRAFEAAYEKRETTAGQVYNVGGGLANAVSLLELLENIEKWLHRRVNYQFHDSRPGDQPVYITDFSKLRQHTGWSPRLGVQQTVDSIHRWWKENQHLLAPIAAPAAAPHGSLAIQPEAAA